MASMDKSPMPEEKKAFKRGSRNLREYSPKVSRPYRSSSGR